MKQLVVALSAPQKPYHPSPVQDSKSCGFGGLLSRPAVHTASRHGEEHSSITVLRNLWREEEEVLVRLSEKSDLPFIDAREGGTRLRRELKGPREMKRIDSSRRVQCSHLISTTAKTFHLPSDLSYTRSAWQKIIHRLGSFPQGAARRDEAWRGVARRAAEEERAWMSLLFSCSYKWGRCLPYKKVQLPLN